MESLFYFALLLWILTTASTASDICTDLQFTNVSDDTVHAREGDTITLTFKPDISKCSKKPERILIKVTGSQEYCKMTVEKGTCKASDQTSTVCRCVDGSENIQFTINADGSNDKVYHWIWSNSDAGTERNHSIRFNVSSSPFSKPVIVGLQRNHVLRVGEDLTLTCVVPWAKPSFFSLNFTCGHRNGSFHRTTGLHTLTFDPLTAADNGAKCRCTATWLRETNPSHTEVSEVSEVLTVKESKKVVSIATMIMAVTLSHLTGVLCSAAIFLIILRRKVRPRTRRMGRRRLPPRPTPLCLTTNVAAYDDIPDSWTTSEPPEGIADIIKRKSRSSTGPHVKSWRPLTSSGKQEAAPSSEAPDDQGTLYMYLEPVNASQNSTEITNSQHSSDKSPEDTAQSRCVIEVEAAVAITPPEISTSPNVSTTETTSSDNTTSAATSKDATKSATSTPPLAAVSTDVVKSSTAITPAATPSKAAWKLTTVISTDALKTATRFLQVAEPAGTSTNATKPETSARPRAATPKVTPNLEEAASTDAAKPEATSTDNINPAIGTSNVVGKLTVVTSNNVSKLIAALSKDDTYSAVRSTDDIKRTALKLRNATKPTTAAVDVTTPATKDVSKQTTATKDATKPTTAATDATKPATAATKDVYKQTTATKDVSKQTTATKDATKPTTAATDATKPATAATKDVYKQTTATKDVSKQTTATKDATKPTTAATDATKPATAATKDIYKQTTATKDVYKQTTATKDATKPTTAATDATKAATAATKDVYKQTTATKDVPKQTTATKDASKPTTAATNATKPTTATADATKPATAAADVTKQQK